MRLILLTSVAALALVSAAAAQTDPSGAKPDYPATHSNIRVAADSTGNVVGGTGVEQSSESQGATNKQGKTDMLPNQGAGNMQGTDSSDQGGTGVKGSAQGEGANNKSTMDPGVTGMNQGDSSGNASGGTGVETSSQGKGTKNKTSNE